MARSISFAEYCFNETVGKNLDPSSLDMEQAKLDYEQAYPDLKTCVFVDDCRLPTSRLEGFGNWTVCRNFEEWVQYLSIHGCPDLVSFDHDLAEEHYQDYQRYELKQIAAIEYDSFKYHTGLQCAQYYAAFCEQNELEMGGVNIHCTERAMGAYNIRDFLTTYLKSVGKAPICPIAAIPSTTELEIANRAKLVVS